MNRRFVNILAIALSFGIASFAYAVDRVGSPQKGETTDSPAATGSGPGASKAPMPPTASTISGELLKVEGGSDDGFYTVKDTSGKEVRLHVNRETKMDAPVQVGDKIEARSNQSGHALSIKKVSTTGMGTGGTGATGSGPTGEQSTPSKIDSGAPGTPGGAAPGTSSGTEPQPKSGTGR
jgi:hypothetical protein